MRGPWWALGCVVLLGCQQLTAGLSAVRVEVAYATFQPGCLSVTATDAAEASHTQTQQLPVDTARSATRTVAVFRKPDWSRRLIVSASAREGSCDGPEVATSSTPLELPERGSTVVYLDLRAEDLDGDGFVSVQGGGTDCDDTNPAVHPGAEETCDGQDTNCSGDEEDAAVKRTWYVDRDGDGYGSAMEPTVQACARPAGYVSVAGDCVDSDAAVHPGVSEALCDGRDDNCDGHVDETFHVGEACTSEALCAGVYECTGDHTASRCHGTATPTTWYADRDGDGRFGTALPLATCARPEGASATRDDCDDTSRFLGGPEVCDRLDNDCDGAVDEGGVCATVGWRPDTVGPGTTWEAVTTYAKGKAWVAGAAGQVRHVAGGRVTDASSVCGGADDWMAAWARPRDGRVFLGSAQGRLASVALAGSTCADGTPDGVVGRITGLVGFEQGDVTTVYAVTSGGYVLRWDWRDVPASLPPPQVVVQLAANLRAVHGAGPGLLLAVGAEDYRPGTGALPRVFQLDTTTGGWKREPLPAGVGTGYLRAVYAVDEDRAYAVGDSGLVLERQAGAWSLLPAPDGAAAPDLVDVVAFHPSVVLALSNQSPSTVHLYNGRDWSEAYESPKPLRSLDALGPTEQWAAGRDGTVVRWGEP